MAINKMNILFRKNLIINFFTVVSIAGFYITEFFAITSTLIALMDLSTYNPQIIIQQKWHAIEGSGLMS
jgi:hypothetical protein